MSFDGDAFERGLQQQREHEQATQYGTVLQGAAALSPQTAPYLAGQMSVKANQSIKRSFAIPINARSIHIYTTGDWSALTAVGDQTGISYFNRSSSEHFSLMPIAAGVDVSITVGVTAKTADLTLYLVADPETVLAGLLTGPTTTIDSLPVALATDQQAAPWQAPNLAATATFKAQAGLGTVNIIPAVAGKTVYVFSGVMAITTAVAAATAELQDTAGNGLLRMGATVVGNFPFDLRGAPLVAGRGLQLVVAGAAATAQVGLGASQA